jgi:hypothetical protein
MLNTDAMPDRNALNVGKLTCLCNALQVIGIIAVTFSPHPNSVNKILPQCRVAFKSGILCALKTGLGQKTGTWSRTLGVDLGSGA